MMTATLLAGAMMLFLTEHMQLVSGLTPARTGVWILGPMAASLVAVIASPLLARRVRPAYLIAGGIAVAVVGLLLNTAVGVASGPLLLIIGWSVTNLGCGPFVSLGTNIVVGAVPPEKAGSAAALNETAGQLGYALGIAALGSVGTAIYRSRIGASMPEGVPADAARGAHDTLAGALNVAQSLPDRVGSALTAAARAAFTDGMHVAAAISAVALAVMVVLVLRALRDLPPIGAPAPAEAAADSETGAGSKTGADAEPVAHGEPVGVAGADGEPTEPAGAAAAEPACVAA